MWRGMTGDRRPLLVVDGDNLAHRAYHSTPKSVIGRDGFPVNAITGFFSMLSRIWVSESPRAVFVAWDSLGSDTYRNSLWPPYQTGRVFEPEIVQQLNSLPELCSLFSMGVGKHEGFEADDLLATAALTEVSDGGTALLLTSDRDAYQLVSPSITVISQRKGTRDLDRIGPAEVVQRLGVLPEQVPDFKALAGDPSDKIPGIRGIGPKTAASLLLSHGSLDQVVSGWQAEDVKAVLLFREVVRMQFDAPVSLPQQNVNWVAGAAALRGLGATSLADRLSKLS